MDFSIVSCYLLILFFICAFSKIPTGHNYVRSFFAHFSRHSRPLSFFPPANTEKTDMPVSEVSIPKNGILALARGSHLRRVFPVPHVSKLLCKHNFSVSSLVWEYNSGSFRHRRKGFFSFYLSACATYKFNNSISKNEYQSFSPDINFLY